MIYFWLILLILLVLVLFTPIAVHLDYIDGKTKVHLCLLWFVRRLVFDSTQPKKKKAKKPKKAEKKPKKATTKKVEEEKEKNPLMDIVQIVLDVLPSIGGMLSRLLRGITITHCKVGLLLYSEDPHKLGVNCANYNAAVYSLYTLLGHYMKIKHFKVTILPNYVMQRSSTAAELKLHSTLWKVLGGVLYFVFTGGITIIKSQLGKEQANKPKVKTA